MESSGPGAHVDMAIHMSANTFDHFAVNAFDNLPDSTALGANQLGDAALNPSYMASPAQQIFHDHSRPSNIRGAEGESDHDLDNDNGIHPLPASPIATGANMPALAMGQTVNQENERVDMVGRFMNEPLDNTEPISAVSEMSLNLEEMKGYAQLVFPDGEYLVTSTEIMLGRDERAQQILRDQEKRQKKLLREQALRQAKQHAAELNAQAALERYKLEPGTGSEEGRRGSSASSHILEGRPAPGLPSTFSESGGIVNYEGSVEDIRRKRNKRRHLLLSRSSSTNSVAPASLHVYGAAAAPWGSNEDEKCIFLPIHPFQIEDIRKISKEHLRIFYDGLEKHWKMEIKGNGAFVLNELYKETSADPETGDEDVAPRHFKRGDTVILTHNSEVLVTSLTFLFKLPQRRGFSTFDSDAEDDPETSPTQQQVDENDDDDDDAQSELSEEDARVKQEHADVDGSVKRPKILLKASKPRPALEPDSPEVPRTSGGKGKKKPAEAPKPAEPEPITQIEATADNTQQQPPVFDANSTLQHVPVNELPEKRKGPGRPPKNGLVSKRDEGIIRRKMKEYEKRGERPPPYKDILAIVRAENRAKELAARAAARGEPMPSAQLEMMNAVPTTEVDQMNDTPDPTTRESAQASETPIVPQVGSQDIDAAEMLKNAQQTQRTYKSPSPMKPKEEYTEEQLKRPTQTYYYILDEILTEGPEDAMELQQIYDKICKKYPFYKYVVESTGWQSSVRHNLKQNERFKPVSKQGKGWLWAIDPSVPLDKEKKKKPTPPPMPRPAPMHYGAQNGMPYNNGAGYAQYGQPYAQAQYAQGNVQQQAPQPQQGGPQQMYNPSSTGTPQAYAQNGQMAVQQSTPSMMPATSPPGQAQLPMQPAVPRTVSHPPSRPSSNTPQPMAGPPTGALPPAFQDLVEEIMRFRVEYLAPFGKDEQSYTRHERIFKRCVEWISQLHMRQNPQVKFENEEEKRVFQILEKMRHKFERGGSTLPTPQTAPPGVDNNAPAGQPAGTALPSAALPATAGQPVQPALPPQPSAVSGRNVLQPEQATAVPDMAMQGQAHAVPQIGQQATVDTTMTQAQGSGLEAQVSTELPSASSAHATSSVVSETPITKSGTDTIVPAVTQDVPSAAAATVQPPSQLPPSGAGDHTVGVAASSEQPTKAVAQPGVLAGTKRSASVEIVDAEHDEKRAKL